MRRTIIVAAVLFTLLVETAPAGAISNGTVDGNLHPNVVCIPNFRDGIFAGCSTGQLISPTVVLTAGHVTEFLKSTGGPAFVSLDPSFDPATSKLIRATSVITHPDFNPGSLFNDMGVILLSKPVKGVVPVQLPTPGLLDQMQAAGAFPTPLTVVGYGAAVDCSGAGHCTISSDQTRKYTTESVTSCCSLQGTVFQVQMNSNATGTGGFCFGDSGAPHFLPDSNMSVGITQGPADTCHATGFVTRIDTSAARSFLGNFVTLP